MSRSAENKMFVAMRQVAFKTHAISRKEPRGRAPRHRLAPMDRGASLPPVSPSASFRISGPASLLSVRCLITHTSVERHLRAPTGSRGGCSLPSSERCLTCYSRLQVCCAFGYKRHSCESLVAGAAVIRCGFSWKPHPHAPSRRPQRQGCQAERKASTFLSVPGDGTHWCIPI